MCKAIDDMVRDGVREGRSTGIKTGIILAQKLIQDNRQEELLRLAADSELQRKLMEEYALYEGRMQLKFRNLLKKIDSRIIPMHVY